MRSITQPVPVAVAFPSPLPVSSLPAKTKGWLSDNWVRERDGKLSYVCVCVRRVCAQAQKKWSSLRIWRAVWRFSFATADRRAALIDTPSQREGDASQRERKRESERGREVGRELGERGCRNCCSLLFYEKRKRHRLLVITWNMPCIIRPFSTD